MQDPFLLSDFPAYERNNPFMAYNLSLIHI